MITMKKLLVSTLMLATAIGGQAQVKISRTDTPLTLCPSLR